MTLPSSATGDEPAPVNLALYRKYRPSTFAEVRGQDHVTEPLTQALRNGRVHHAYLFSGPRGCGKTSSARILARSLNCERGPTPDPCGVCDSCVGLAATGPGSLDVIEIDAASHGGVDDARDLRERAFFAPVSSRFKIYIIDEAHMVTREGFNALLKLVEEPPPHLKFVFATTEPEKVIGTIKSRTHHYPFRLVPPATLRELLESILDEEKIGYEPAALSLVVRAGAGSVRDALSVLDQLIAGADESGVSYARAVSLLGYTDSGLLNEVVDAFAAGDGGTVFGAIDRVVEGGHDPRRFATDLLERLRDLVVLSAVPDAGSTGLLDAPPDEMERMRAQAAQLGPAVLTRAAEIFHAGLTEMRGATSPRLLLELMCARVLLPAATDDPAALLARIERVERRLDIGAGPAAGPAAGSAAGSAAEGHPAGRPPSRPAAADDEQEGAGPGGAPEGSGSAAEPTVPAARSARSPRGRAAAAGTPDTSGASGAPGATPPTGASVPSPGGSDDSGGSGMVASPAPSPPSAASPSAASPAPVAPGGASRAAAPAAGPGGLDVAAVRGAWDAVLEAVKRRRRVAWMILLNNVHVSALDGGMLTLEFARDGDVKGFTSSGSDGVLAEALYDVLGVRWRIAAVPAGASGASGSPGGRTGAGGNAGEAAGPAAPGAAPAALAATTTFPAGPASAVSEAVDPADAPGPRPVTTGSGASGTPSRGPGSASRPRPPASRPSAAGPAGTAGTAEADEPDPDNDADAAADLTGMALVQRELGGELIEEIGPS